MAGSLTAEEQHKVEGLRQAVAARLEASPEIKQWCTTATLLRYLRARNWDLTAATTKLKASIEWRDTYKPHHIRWADVQEEAKTGKQFVYQSADRDGRPIVVMRPRNENSRNTEKQIAFLVYHLELASRRAEESGVDKMTWLIDFVGYKLANAPPIKVSMHTLHLLQNHYPERLGLAICYRPPTLFSLTYKATSPFIDPVTYRKIHFVEKGAKGQALMAEKFDLDHLEECLGGHSTWQFDFEAYGAAMKQEDAKLQRAIEAAAA